MDVLLCAKHQEQYRRGTRRITVIQIVSVVCSFACFSLLYINPIPRSGLTVGQTIAVSFAGFFLLCAYFSIGFRCRILPLRVNVRNYDRILKYGAYTFQFEDRRCAERFAVANVESTKGNQTTEIATTIGEANQNDEEYKRACAKRRNGYISLVVGGLSSFIGYQVAKNGVSPYEERIAYMIPVSAFLVAFCYLVTKPKVKNDSGSQ